MAKGICRALVIIGAISLIVLTACDCAGTTTVQPRRQIIRHAAIRNNAGGHGSAVCVGWGLVLTTEHVLFDENGCYMGGVLYFKGKADTNFTVILKSDRLVLLKSEIAVGVTPITIGSLRVGLDIFWPQPFYISGAAGNLSMLLFLMRGHVAAQSNGGEYLLGGPAWAGSSGAGVYTTRGDLAGIIYGYINFMPFGNASPPSFGIVDAIPEDVRALIKRETQTESPYKADERVARTDEPRRERCLE